MLVGHVVEAAPAPKRQPAGFPLPCHNVYLQVGASLGHLGSFIGRTCVCVKCLSIIAF